MTHYKTVLPQLSDSQCWHRWARVQVGTESSGDSTEEEQYLYSLTKSYVTTVGSYSGASNYTGTGACPAHIVLQTSDDEGRGSPLESGPEIKFGPYSVPARGTVTTVTVVPSARAPST